MYVNHREEMGSRLLSVASGSSPLENNVQLISAVVIIFEHSFFVFDKRRYLQDKRESVPSFLVALWQYIASPHAAVVREGVSAAVQAYEEAATTAARAYEEAVTTAARAYEEALTTAANAYEEAVRTLPTWIAKLPFEYLQRKAKEAFERSKEKEKEAFERSKKMEKEAFERSKKKEKESSCSQAEAELTKTILEITLNHRLPRP
ncbi:hypothetical protein F4604DRAFT_1955651 [Suillus subluteus]|nr:hypothetical protein F4604DRAFT_1955651 [Suillus subluteus]